ncbi:hypothetical protein ISJ10_09270 [Burkholderia pseudomallei]|uniref:hypothetical protein n=1 Tax=Burkholderia pseudomallei TaxID=28450 RepID=UPI0013C428F9|nr:hypothetical protein [Burkholderia pseudomallei]MBF3778990.1 hypothetical protein [Burkholderia pseudomallei]MBF4060250.1 hypothetical protein [Burkholderia pseudomallei]MBF4078348.1 hypothetical protein [Burkholderia pseudomallei]
MSHIRTIKPQFFTSEDVVELSLGARLLYIAMWCEADREGRFVWRPKTFKMRYFPADDLDTSVLAGELVDRGLMVLYGDGYAYIPTFAKHQHINPRESASILPIPPHASITRASRVHGASATRDHTSNTSQHACNSRFARTGGKGKGREGDRRVRVASCDDATPAVIAPPPVVTLPLNDGSEYGICAQQVAEWGATYPNVDVPQQLREMRQWSLANPAKRKTKRGVLAFANSWLAREQDKPNHQSGNGRATDDPFKGGI